MIRTWFRVHWMNELKREDCCCWWCVKRMICKMIIMRFCAFESVDSLNSFRLGVVLLRAYFIFTVFAFQFCLPFSFGRCYCCCGSSGRIGFNLSFILTFVIYIKQASIRFTHWTKTVVSCRNSSKTIRKILKTRHRNDGRRLIMQSVARQPQCIARR